MPQPSLMIGTSSSTRMATEMAETTCPACSLPTTPPLGPRRMHRNCYRRHWRAGTLAAFPTRPRSTTRDHLPQAPCVNCGIVSSNQGRGLCPKCHTRMRRSGRLEEFPPLGKPKADDYLEEFIELREVMSLSLWQVQEMLHLSDYQAQEWEKKRRAQT